MEHAVGSSLLTLVLAELGRAAGPHAAPRTGRGNVVVESLRYIERHCLGPLSLGDAARAVGRSPAYVTPAAARAIGS